jgi:hypothetical protein
MEISSAGTAADRLLRVTDGLDGVDVLRSEAALAVVTALGPERERRILQRLQAMGENPSDYADLHVVVPRTSLSLAELASRGVYSQEVLWPTIASLAERRIIFAGLNIRCPHCGTEEWRAIDDVAQTLTCVGCRVQISLSASTRDDREPKWSYTLNRAVAWPLEQDVLVVVFAVQALVRRAKYASHFVIGVLPEGVNGPEFDAILTVDEDVFVLEGKSGASLSETDVTKTAQLASRLGGTAIFATLSMWSDEATRLIADGSAGHKPQILTRKDLILGDAASDQTE